MWDLVWQCLLCVALWMWANICWLLLLASGEQDAFFAGLGDAIGEFMVTLLLWALLLGGAVVLCLVLIVRALTQPRTTTPAAAVAVPSGSCSPVEDASPPAR